jgi:hypothetical protein
LIAVGLVQLKQSGGGVVVWCRHRLLSTVLGAALNPCRRRLFERRMVPELRDAPASAAQVRMLMRAEERDLALEKALEWAHRHVESDQPQTALEVLGPVMSWVEASGLTDTQKARLFLLHAASLLMTQPTNGHTARSLAVANALGKGEGDHFEAEVHLLQSRIQRVIGHYPNFRDHLMHAWQLIEHGKPSALGANVAGLLGWSNRVAGAVDAAATWHGRARRIAVQTGDAGARAHAEVGVAGWQYARGLLEDSV